MSASTPLPPVVQGDADYRSYRPVALPNGLVLLLAHDPTSRHVAAAVSVRAGASADPRCAAARGETRRRALHRV